MTRRRFLKLGAAMAGAVLYGCEMNGKKNIKDFGRTFDYLSDPVLRKKDLGDAQLVVEGAEFSGVKFQGQEWRNIKFVNCDFVGAYDIKQALIAQSSFEGCKFAGIFNLGVLKQVRFVRCLISGTSHVVGDTGSLDVTFEQCEQIGKDPEPNHWGSFGSYGEVAFIKCKAKWTNVTGETKHLIRDCDFESVDCSVSKDGGGSAVLIENSRLLGGFDMRPATLLSLTIRDTTIEGTFDMTNATVKGDILMERVTAGVIKAGIKEGARSFTLRDSQIKGDGQRVCNIYAGAFQHVLMENVVFGRAEGQPVGVGGGYEPDDKKPQPVLTQSLILKNVKAPSWRSARLNAALVRVERSEFLESNFKEGRINTLELVDVTVGSSIDFTGTQVGEFKQSGTTDLKRLGRGLKLEGSNIKLPR
ncbi:hypothetical protein FFI97_000595 [Variovorax sp. KBS0712]|uniref:pentapeptide repeat-containing protein n=1 Tax=Variovorax sp. KBS0712 TaxID=2578111 RepID=UPI0011193B07|nr:hypothetical protein [Variovorax sp. KBS0712]TSD58872.1 hypothetical protein FFI97_000595 [Variovorax sp. KBS0712]